MVRSGSPGEEGGKFLGGEAKIILGGDSGDGHVLRGLYIRMWFYFTRGQEHVRTWLRSVLDHEENQEQLLCQHANKNKSYPSPGRRARGQG